jgi:hypothetical protein
MDILIRFVFGVWGGRGRGGRLCWLFPLRGSKWTLLLGLSVYEIEDFLDVVGIKMTAVLRVGED